MRRNAQGKYVRRTAYLLRYDDGDEQVVRAYTPALAVQARGRALLPSTITDLDVLAAFADQRPHGTPLLDRMYGPRS